MLLNISPESRAAGRFIGDTWRKLLMHTAVNRTAYKRMIKASESADGLTLRDIAEISLLVDKRPRIVFDDIAKQASDSGGKR